MIICIKVCTKWIISWKESRKNQPFSPRPSTSPHSLGPRRRSGICWSACGQEEVNLLFLDFVGGYFILGDFFLWCLRFLWFRVDSSGVFACQLWCLKCFVTCYLVISKSSSQMVVKLTYAKEKQKSYFFLKTSLFGKNRDVLMFHHTSRLFIALPYLFSCSFPLHCLRCSKVPKITGIAAGCYVMPFLQIRVVAWSSSLILKVPPPNWRRGRHSCR